MKLLKRKCKICRHQGKRFNQFSPRSACKGDRDDSRHGQTHCPVRHPWAFASVQPGVEGVAGLVPSPSLPPLSTHGSFTEASKPLLILSPLPDMSSLLFASQILLIHEEPAVSALFLPPWLPLSICLLLLPCLPSLQGLDAGDSDPGCDLLHLHSLPR